MTVTMSRTQPYTVVEQTNHWDIIDGRYYRRTIVRRADGELRIYLIPDGTVGAL